MERGITTQWNRKDNIMEHKLDENHLKYGGYNRKHVNARKNKFRWNLK